MVRASGRGGVRSPVLHWRRVRAAQNDVECVTECPFRLGHVDIELRDESLGWGLLWYAVRNRIDWHQRIARKVHLRDEPTQEAAAEQREMNMCRAPCVWLMAPWIPTGVYM